MSTETRSLATRVGVFMAVGLMLAALAIFAVGEKSGIFESKATIYVYFDNISGLVEGAPVRLAGLDVGVVSRIQFPHQLERKQARVTLSIKSRFMTRIRKDSRALIDSKGLLGDKIINITLGSAGQPQLIDGDTLQTRTSPSMEHLATQIEEALTAVTQVTKTTDHVISELGVADIREDVKRIATSIANIVEEVERGDGVAHRVIYDKRYADEVGRILVETRSTMERMRGAAERIDRTVAEIQNGDGMLHELVYGESGKETIASLRSASDDLAQITREVREGKGLLHDLVFEEDEITVLDDLSEITGRINRITQDVEKGRGTIGGLLVDPSVYEDLKTVLGNVERNVLLKALIRFTIKEGDIERPANVPARPGGE
ncbi:MAG: MlaD family protein [Myxococcales bacterium]|nr:MlaD family protein [Myxococcales bacterium]